MNFLELINTSAKTQEKLIQKQNKPKRTRKNYDSLSSITIENIRKDYMDGDISVIDITKKYNLSKGKLWSLTNDLPKRERGANYTSINYNYFEIIDTPDKAYFLGFITADCHIEKPRKEIRFYNENPQVLKFQLSATDVELLEKFKKFTKSEHIIRFKEIFNPKIQKEPSQGCTLKIGCIKLVQGLAKHGVTNNKSHDCKVPTTIPPHLIRHYLRGLIDGDGGWTFDDKGNGLTKQLVLHFCSSYEPFINEVQDLLIKEIGLETKTVIISKNNTYFQFRYGGNKQCVKIFNYLYGEGGPWLSRKYMKSSEHLLTLGLIKNHYQE